MSEVALAAPSAAAPRLRLSLAWKFAAALVGLVVFILVVNGVVNIWLGYNEAKDAAVRVQQEKAQAAAERITQFVSDIESQIGWTTRAEWSRIPLDQRRYDFIRLMRQAPAIAELIHVDGAGVEQLKLSHVESAVVAGKTEYATDPRFTEAAKNGIWFSPVYFRRGSEPYMTVSIAHAGRSPGVTIAEVNLKLVWDIVTGIRIGEKGYAYIVNGQGRLVAHPDMSIVLRDTDLSKVPQVARAMAAGPKDTQANTAATETDLDGVTVLTAFAAIPRVNWIVFVQLPLREALASVYQSLAQTAALLGLGLLLATIMGALLARRLTVPIRRLQSGAEELGRGELEHRIDIHTGDEIETLADRFNQMAASIQESHATLEAKVEQRTEALRREQREARDARLAAETALGELRTAQDRLVQSEKLASLGQLTAGIAHEIKNPLNFVNNFADVSTELVEELRTILAPGAAQLDAKVRDEVDDLTEMLKANLGKVVQHGRRADSIVKNMLLHSREGGGERRAVDFNATAEEAMNLAYHGARAEKPGFNVTLVKTLDPAVGEVEVFPQEFTRVLLNLIGNGFYAANQRKIQSGDASFEPTLTLTTRNLGERVEIRVRDNGTGIPDKVREMMFNPFFTTKPAGEGTGLGLSLSFDIVKQHGGTISVDTAVGEFTEFTIVLPRVAAGAVQ